LVHRRPRRQRDRALHRRSARTMARGSGRDVQRSHRAPVAVVTADLGLFILRVVVGAIVMAHGLLKLGWVGRGGSTSGVAGWFRPGWRSWPWERCWPSRAARDSLRRRRPERGGPAGLPADRSSLVDC